MQVRSEPFMDIELAKFNMVEQQIRTWNVLDPRILETINAVPRENFVPEQYLHQAFADMQVPIGDGQVMMQPKVEARLLQALAPGTDELALEIGTGTGYVAGLLAHHALEVHTVECREQFVELAKRHLAANHFDNVQVIHGDAGQGWHSDIEYHLVFVSGSVIELPDNYRELLCIGGRLVAVVGENPIMNAILVRRVEANRWETEYLFETLLPPLDNIKQPDRFQF